MRKQTFLGSILLTRSLVTRKQLAEALSLQLREYPGRSVGSLLLMLGHLTQYQLDEALASQQRRRRSKVATRLAEIEDRLEAMRASL